MDKLTGGSASAHVDELHLKAASHYIRQILRIAETAAEGLRILQLGKKGLHFENI